MQGHAYVGNGVKKAASTIEIVSVPKNSRPAINAERLGIEFDLNCLKMWGSAAQKVAKAKQTLGSVKRTKRVLRGRRVSNVRSWSSKGLLVQIHIIAWSPL